MQGCTRPCICGGGSEPGGRGDDGVRQYGAASVGLGRWAGCANGAERSAALVEGSLLVMGGLVARAKEGRRGLLFFFEKFFNTNKKNFYILLYFIWALPRGLR